MGRKKKEKTWICKNCGKEFHSEIKHRYCSEECKQEFKDKKYLLVCENCGKEYYGTIHKTGEHHYCSDECRNKVHNTNSRNNIIAKRQKKLSEGEEGYDYITCKLCGLKVVQLNNAHFTMFHPDMTLAKYKNLFPDAPCVCQKYIDEYLKGKNNPRSASKISQEEIRKNSPFCKEFYETRGLDDSVRVKMVKEMSKRPPEKQGTSIEYFLAKGYTEEEALKKRKEVYGFTLEKAIEKYGEEEGKRIFLERQRKWIESMYADSSACKCKSNISGISQKFIKDVLGVCSNCNNTFLFGKKEYTIEGIDHVYKYDLTCYKNKRIIEFHGDLWHGNPKMFEETDCNPINGQPYSEKWKYDSEKKETAENNGFEVMVVWESDYKNFRKDVVEKAREFIFKDIDLSDILHSVALF